MYGSYGVFRRGLKNALKLQVKLCLALLALLPLLCLGIADVDVEIGDSNYMLGRAVADTTK